MKSLKVADVRGLVQQVIDAELGTRMVQYVHAVLRNALEHAVRDEVIPRNVAKLVQVKTPTYDVGRGLSVDQVNALLAAAKIDRLHALYVLAVYLGPRRGEVLGLMWGDLDLVEERLEVARTLQRVEAS